MGKELLVVARPVARSTAFAEQVQELPANPPPHRCLDADRLEGGRKGGGLPPGLVAGAKPPRPLPPNCACCACIHCIACVCLRQCACCVHAFVRPSNFSTSVPFSTPSTRDVARQGSTGHIACGLRRQGSYTLVEPQAPQYASAMITHAAICSVYNTLAFIKPQAP